MGSYTPRSHFDQVKISATIIVRNEEHNIAAVCDTVSWADEIVVVDSDSTDRTVELARQFTDRVFNREFRGYKDKHEFADAQTTGDWIFWIDADERLSPELLAAIETIRQSDETALPDGFRIAGHIFSIAGSNIPAGIPITRCGSTGKPPATGMASRRMRPRE